MQKIILLIVGVIILAGGIVYLTSGSKEQTPTQQVQAQKEQTLTVQVTNRKLSPEIVTVTEGEKVTIRVMSDESGEFHISGYEIENDMTVGTELSFSFTADKAGRYNFELHPKAAGADEEHEATETTEDTPAAEAEEDIVIGAFVVNPR
ncbi:cupredoxin domain-containing protein [Patescibacteria group bacterium]|nr:cupredoxin domain-containing protein [Patescibacteria group bacterium]